MCLIALSWKTHSPYRLVVAANRDEDLSRPTRASRFWEEIPGVLAGKDLLSGGTWMAVSTRGRFAAVTNFREDLVRRSDAPSRGVLVLDFVRGGTPPADYASAISVDRYAGFGLFVGDASDLSYVSNRLDGVKSLSPGVYGLSNSLLDDPWPKVIKAKRELDEILRGTKSDKLASALLSMLSDRSAPPEDDGALDRTPMFIKGDSYGTRSSTVLLVRDDGETIFAERTFDASGRANGTQTFRFRSE